VGAKLSAVLAVCCAIIAEIGDFGIEAAHGMVIVKVLFPDCKFKSVKAQSN